MEELNKYSSTIILYSIIVISATIAAFASYRKGVLSRTGENIAIKKKPTISFFGAGITFIILWFPIAFANCGADYMVYNMLFDRAKDWAFCVGYHQIEIGWAAFNYILRIFTDNVDIYNAILAFVFLLIIFKAFFSLRDRIHFGWGILAFTTCVYLPFMNLKRISIAMAIIFCAIKPLLEKKYLKAISYIAIACLFHTSAIIMIIPIAINWMIGRKLKYREILFCGVLAFFAIYLFRERIANIIISERYDGYGLQNSSFGMMQMVYHLPLLYFLLKKSKTVEKGSTMTCLILLVCSFIVGSIDRKSVV